MTKITEFQQLHPTEESYLRSIILFGNNVASYKFALSKSLLEIMPTGKSSITLEELAVPYSKYICEHIKNAPRQATSRTSQFLEACQAYNEGKITHEQLIDVAVKKGFNNVIDAFHVVNQEKIPIQFFEKDYVKGNKRIILTDYLLKLMDLKNHKDLMNETEARWRLVETAWELGISRSLLDVKYDGDSEELYINKELKRKSVTSVRDALNGYQKGKCFYCFDDITVSGSEELNCDVDHFFAHTMQKYVLPVNLDGVWNLVLTCPNCNRGPNGKFAKVPTIKYVERLHRRNEFLISSHHPLRETLMQQTGNTEAARKLFLDGMYRKAVDTLVIPWSVEPVGEEVF